MNRTAEKDAGNSGKTELALPWDLSEWAEPEQLLRWVEEEVDRLDWNNPQVVEHVRKHPGARPKMMLCLMTWAYTTGLFESAEISLACDREKFLQPFCQRKPPSANAIARFRRDNRGLLKWSITQLFRRVLRARFNLPGTFWPAGLNRHLADAAVQRLDLGRQMDRGASGF